MKIIPFDYPVVYTAIKEPGLVPYFINLAAATIAFGSNIFIWYQLTKMLAHAVKLGLQ